MTRFLGSHAGTAQVPALLEPTARLHSTALTGVMYRPLRASDEFVRVQPPYLFRVPGNLTGRNHHEVAKLNLNTRSLIISPAKNLMHTSNLGLIFLGLLAVLSILTAQPAAADPLITYRLRIKTHELRAEIANTEESRRRGLMYRDRLAQNSGMIFVYPRPEAAAMWMKNTGVALSVAFIGANGRILNIADMAPHSEQAHASAGEAAYALEMNRGWFSKRKIMRGDLVEGLKALPLAK